VECRKKNNCVCSELKPGCSAQYLVTIMTELYQLIIRIQIGNCLVEDQEIIVELKTAIDLMWWRPKPCDTLHD
jgi:hypothetical protein